MSKPSERAQRVRGAKNWSELIDAVKSIEKETRVTKESLINKEVTKIADELKNAGFTPDQINALYHSMHRVVQIAELSKMDPRLLEGDDEMEIRGY